MKETNPAGHNIKYLNMRWSQLYSQKYLPWCRHTEVKAVRYNIFTDIRKKERPYFQRSPKIKYGTRNVMLCCYVYDVIHILGGWNHVGCHNCENLGDRIRREKLQTFEKHCGGSCCSIDL
jgi:hypothetical protein